MKTQSRLKIEPKYRSDLDASIHEAASDLYEIGFLSSKTMRQFDRSCLTEITQLTPEEIAELRHHCGFSQSVFATYFNVTTGIVSKWERGEKHPAGPALKLLNLAKKKGINAIA